MLKNTVGTLQEEEDSKTFEAELLKKVIVDFKENYSHLLVGIPDEMKSNLMETKSTNSCKLSTALEISIKTVTSKVKALKNKILSKLWVHLRSIYNC